MACFSRNIDYFCHTFNNFELMRWGEVEMSEFVERYANITSMRKVLTQHRTGPDQTEPDQTRNFLINVMTVFFR